MKIINLTCSYEDKKVIENLNLEIGKGITCILGENGKGKTTLLKCLAGLLKQDSGVIEGGPLKPSVCFQEDRLFEEFTVRENLLAISDHKEDIAKILGDVGLSSMENVRVNTLSGGQKRRLAIARALLYKGDCLLLDEPMKGIDSENRDKIMKLLMKCDVPVIMITHDMSDVKSCGAKAVTLS